MSDIYRYVPIQISNASEDINLFKVIRPLSSHEEFEEHITEEKLIELKEEAEEIFPKNIKPARYQSYLDKCITFSSHQIEEGCCLSLTHEGHKKW